MNNPHDKAINSTEQKRSVSECIFKFKSLNFGNRICFWTGGVATGVTSDTKLFLKET